MIPIEKKLKILYLTKLNGYDSSGPTYSVPAQIVAQSKLDNVYWLNRGTAARADWDMTGLFHSTENIPFTWELIPAEFKHPDLVVFEDFYQFEDVKIARYLRYKKIPYIIVPRGAMTKGAQRIKWLKKFIANILCFISFSRRALGIQFLSQEEYDNSSSIWNRNRYIVPNGINMPDVHRKRESLNNIVFSFIGRIRVHHKGLDILIDAIGKKQDLMRANNCIVNLYGQNLGNSRDEVGELIQKNNVSDIVYLNEGVFGKDKEQVMLQTDVFLLTSRFEGLPMGLLEALSYGLPSLVTVGSNMGDVIAEHDAGWVSETTADGVALSIEKCINNRDFEQKSVNAINLAKKYDWQSIALLSHKKYIELLYL